MTAAGPDNLVQVVNSAWAIYPTTGGAPTYQTTFDAWFHTSDNLFDPRVYYDQTAQQFVMVVDDNTSFWIQVSSNATASYWCYAHIPAYNLSSGEYLDFPMIGGDGTNIDIAFNVFNGNTFEGPQVYVIPQSGLTSCGSSYTYYTFTGMRDPNTGFLGTNLGDHYAFSMTPAVQTSDNGTTNYLIDSYAVQSSGCDVSEWVIFDDSTPQMSGQQVSLPFCYSVASNANQPNGTPLETLDPRLGNLVYQNFELYFPLTSSYNWGNGNVNSVIEWFEMSSETTSVAGGAVGHAGIWWAFPSLYPEQDGAMVLVNSYTGSSQNPAVVVTGINANNSLNPSLYLQQSGTSYVGGYQSSFGADRWGDLFSASVDPTNGKYIWVDGEWTSGGIDWQTSVGRVTGD